MDKYKKIESLLMKYSHLGYKEVEYEDGTGAKLIGEVPFFSKKIWLNRIYNPIDNNKIIEIEKSIGIIIPIPMKSFLTKFSNGLTFMSGVIELYGNRSVSNRSCLRWQPIDCSMANNDERPINTPKDAIFIGYYHYDCSQVYMTPDGVVHYCARWDATTLHTWSSLEEFLISEIERIYELYNENGELIIPDCPTSPMHLLDL